MAQQEDLAHDFDQCLQLGPDPGPCVRLEPAAADAVMYHVTNIRSNEEHTYVNLRLNIADDRTYDGHLVGLPVVCFTTTLYRDRGWLGLPTRSTYPRNVEAGNEYKRVSVPLQRFRNYDWWEMRRPRDRDQVHLLFTNGHWSTILRNARGLGPIPINPVDKQHYDYLQCRVEGENALWSLNVYQPRESPFVNISVLHEVELNDCIWDNVERMAAGQGDIAQFQQHDVLNRTGRWILEKVLDEEVAAEGSPVAIMQFQALKAAATVMETGEFQVPDEINHGQLSDLFQRISHFLQPEIAPADLLRSIYHVLNALE